MHIRNAPTGLMQELGYGKDYQYAHDHMTSEGAYVPGESYMPDEIGQSQFYFPQNAGLEAKIQQRLARLRQLDADAPALRTPSAASNSEHPD